MLCVTILCISLSYVLYYKNLLPRLLEFTSGQRSKLIKNSGNIISREEREKPWKVSRVNRYGSLSSTEFILGRTRNYHLQVLPGFRNPKIKCFQIFAYGFQLSHNSSRIFAPGVKNRGEPQFGTLLILRQACVWGCYQTSQFYHNRWNIYYHLIKNVLSRARWCKSTLPDFWYVT